MFFRQCDGRHRGRVEQAEAHPPRVNQPFAQSGANILPNSAKEIYPLHLTVLRKPAQFRHIQRTHARNAPLPAAVAARDNQVHVVHRANGFRVGVLLRGGDVLLRQRHSAHTDLHVLVRHFRHGRLDAVKPVQLIDRQPLERRLISRQRRQGIQAVQLLLVCLARAGDVERIQILRYKPNGGFFPRE